MSFSNSFERDTWGCWKIGGGGRGGASIFKFYWIFIASLKKVFWGVTWGTPLSCGHLWLRPRLSQHDILVNRNLFFYCWSLIFTIPNNLSQLNDSNLSYDSWHVLVMPAAMPIQRSEFSSFSSWAARPYIPALKKHNKFFSKSAILKFHNKMKSFLSKKWLILNECE